MNKQQRRVFLKVIAVGPLLGCGPDPSAPIAGNGGATGTGGNGFGASGSPALNGGAGNTSFAGAGNTSFAGAGNTSSSGGSTSFAGSGPAFGGSTGTAGSTTSVGGAQATAGAAGTGGGTVINPNDPAQPIGNVSLYPLGSFKIAGNIYFMGHDAGGLYAMTMACTHAGCACDIKGTQLTCPCHGSRFDQAGNVLQGPATKPLPHFKVTVDSTGEITVDRFTVVAASTRTPV